MDAATRDTVRQRADGRCEYCRLPDYAIDLPYHVEHIVATAHLADDSENNLAWSCPRCNLKKGPNLATIGPESRQQVNLFNPRSMTWDEHFSMRDAAIVGLTACGRGTAQLLDMNSENRLILRRRLIEQGEF